jgi:hypothetical protein
VPAAGALTSAYQKYGGPSWRWRDVAATLPSGATSDSSPVIGFSAAMITRSGAPFHGASGDGRTAMLAALSQALSELCAQAAPVEAPLAKKTPAASSKTDLAEINRRDGST